jgi:hypothetical protein
MRCVGSSGMFSSYLIFPHVKIHAVFSLQKKKKQQMLFIVMSKAQNITYGPMQGFVC